VHHAGAEASWGEAAQFSFSQGVAAILSLSGTPFRTRRDQIVFVPSLNGAAEPHYRYSYDDAIGDGACRPVQFVEVRGQTTFRTPQGELQTVTFDDRDLTDAGEKLRLRAALEWIAEGLSPTKLSVAMKKSPLVSTLADRRCEGRVSAWIRLLWVWSALMMRGQQGAGEQRVCDPQLVRSSFCCVIAQPFGFMRGNGLGTKRGATAEMAWNAA
jgi:hypothetical protein